jgi:mono/diheme cytochrome c family protein
MWKRILLVLVTVVLLVLGGGLSWLWLRKPAQAQASTIRLDMSPARVARGKYIFESLCDCDGCHSERDFTRFGGPVAPAGRGKGGQFPPEMGLPGTVVAPNITPDVETGLGRWTDGEKIRAIREGVDRDGRALFPMMPYTYYARMSDEDVQALVAFMNTMAPVRNPLPQTRLNFPVNLMIKGVPRPVAAPPAPARGNQVQYGEYLATLAGCVECHSEQVHGQLVAGKQFAGGRVFRMPFGTVVTANITPDLDTGIGKWTEKHFLEKFGEYREYVKLGPPKAGPDAFTLMPWLSLSQLPEEDLKAIYAYLRQQPPVRNLVDTHPGFPGKM